MPLFCIPYRVFMRTELKNGSGKVEVPAAVLDFAILKRPGHRSILFPTFCAHRLQAVPSHYAKVSRRMRTSCANSSKRSLSKVLNGGIS